MQKGGVGKTTNATHLAVALAERGARCLLWDVDENYGTTKLFRAPQESEATSLEVLTGEISAPEAVLRFDAPQEGFALPENVDLIPSSRRLTTLDATLARDPFASPNDCLKKPIAELRALNLYDYIILDTGPSASTTTRGAYMAADYFILSIFPERLAVEGLSDALEDIALARKPGRNPGLHLLGLIVSDMDRRKTLARFCEHEIEKRFRQANAEPVKFRTSIGTAADIDRASYEGKTLLQAQPRHPVAQQYRALAAEVEERIAAHRRQDMKAVANG
jgi:chromosome partitioning protein